MKTSLSLILALCMLLSFSLPSLAEETPDSDRVYTIRFDLNTTPETDDEEIYVYQEEGYDENWQPITQEKQAVFTVPVSDDAYLDVSLPNPVREGYSFAGWQTRPNVTEQDLIYGVSPYIWMLGNKLMSWMSVEGLDAEELETRQLHNEAMYIKDMESLDENGVGTLYARWVKVTPISNEDELRGISKDLYGAYELTADIELTAPWTPIGCYFQNYEYYDLRWWNFAFRGTLNGNGHSIKGLCVQGADIDEEAYRLPEADQVWHHDGVSCDGTAAMFGASAGANIHDLTLVDPVINVSGEFAYDGDYCYAAAISAFDMESHLNGVHVENLTIKVDASEEKTIYRDSLYSTVGGLLAGGWNSVADDCSVSGTIELNAQTVRSHGGNVYLGGLVGECYTYMTNCTADDLQVSLNIADVSEAAEDTALQVNVGGLNGSNTSSSGNVASTKINVQVSKPIGSSSVNIGGYTGSQLYMTAESSTITSEITTSCDLDAEKGSLNVGSVVGRIDPVFLLQILQYTPVAQTGAVGNIANVTWNGEPVNAIVAGIPMVDGEPVSWITNGEYTIAEGYTVPSNIEAIIETYGSYIPQESLMPGIIWITIE